MTHHFDIAIAGSTPLSGLLAGILAQEHNLKSCWIGDFPHPLQPQRGFDVSAAVLTRPESWALLKLTTPETLRILGNFDDANVFERVDPIIIARAHKAATALAHMRSVASGAGIEIEPQPISPLYRSALKVRDAVRLQRRPFLAALPSWLEKVGVRQFDRQRTRIRTPRGGSVEISLGQEAFSADRLVVAGDAAIAGYLPEGDLKKHFDRIAMSAALLEPVAPLPSSIIMHADTGALTYQRANGALDCSGWGDLGRLTSGAMLLAPDGQSTRLAGKSSLHGLIGKNGAPVVGALGRSNVFFIGGLGVTGLFQAPALARLLTDSASEGERAYFAVRGPADKKKRVLSSEYRPDLTAPVSING